MPAVARKANARSPRAYREGAAVFKALGQPSRLLIIDELSEGEKCVTDLTKLIGHDVSTVSNHLAVLRNAGLVIDERRGQQVFYRLVAPCIVNAFHCLEDLRAAREKLS